MDFRTISYVMVNVSDMKRSVAFYRDALGMKLKFESPAWTEFDTGTTILALHGGSKPRSGSPLKGDAETAGECTIGFTVDDLDRVHAALRERGVKFILTPTERPNEGIRLAVCADPDGMPISFAQHLH